MSRNKTITFFHAGCPVCVSAEQQLLSFVDPAVAVDVVHLGEDRSRLAEAEAAGVTSVPAVVLDGGAVLHLNFGASLSDVKGGAS